MDNKSIINYVIIVFIAIAFISALAETLTDTYTTGTETNETLTFDSNTATLNYDDLISLTGLRNSTSEDITGSCNVTLSIGFIDCNASVTSTGLADYTYYPDTYVKTNSTARVLMPIIAIILIALLLIAIYRNKKK